MGVLVGSSPRYLLNSVLRLLTAAAGLEEFEDAKCLSFGSSALALRFKQLVKTRGIRIRLG